jgi:hypothetical protein
MKYINKCKFEKIKKGPNLCLIKTPLKKLGLSITNLMFKGLATCEQFQLM